MNFLLSKLRQLFHFLGGIKLAISLIFVSALMVVAGTFLESQTGSHLLAAKWTYENPFFLLLLCLFFINILFSALRRWPFQTRHIPFLITHFGLLMIIGGTILKNRLGLQGQLSVWEGSGNQLAVLPHTYAISVEEKNHSSDANNKSFISLDNFKPNIYFPFHFPYLKCKVVGYAPHVREKLETWIKGPHAYIAGFPPIPIQDWHPSQSFPDGFDSQFNLGFQTDRWDILALRTSHVREALQHAYLQDISLQIKSRDETAASLNIPLKKALEGPLTFEEGLFSLNLYLPHPPLNDSDLSSLNLCWQSKKVDDAEKFTVFLQGQDSLFVKSPPFHWSEAPFTVDLTRPKPKLLLIDDDQGNTLLFAFDVYGRLHGENFDPTHLKTLISYDHGFSGFGVQAVVPIPSFPAGREDKEKAQVHELACQIQQALVEKPSLTPPLRFFEQACLKAQADFVTTFLEFLTNWHRAPGFLYHPRKPFSPQLDSVLANLAWKEISSTEQQTVQWTSRLLDQLEHSFLRGEHPLKILEAHHWPFLSTLQQAVEQTEKATPLNLLAQQIASLTPHLPSLHFPISLSLQEQAHLLSAYLRAYGIDYRSLCPYRGNKREEFDSLETYWKASSHDMELRQTLAFETPLTHQIIPESPPQKLEDQRPGIVIEFQKGEQKQSLALAYDASGTGLKWSVLNGSYIVRFQPRMQELPYRIRLRQARAISYPQSEQIYSYESDVLVSSKRDHPVAQTLSMNHVYETWDGYRFYLAGVGTSSEPGIKRIQLAVNHDPAKYFLTYPGAVLVFVGVLLLFWFYPSRKPG